MHADDDLTLFNSAVRRRAAAAFPFQKGVKIKKDFISTQTAELIEDRQYARRDADAARKRFRNAFINIFWTAWKCKKMNARIRSLPT